MIQGDIGIHSLIKQGCVLSPDGKYLVNPASINVRIGASFLVPSHTSGGGIHLGGKVEYDEFRIPEDEEFCLQAGEFALATTMEKFDLPDDIAAYVQGRSSIGRAGLSVQNAGFVDPGFRGHITLELKNETRNAIYIRPGYPVAQMVFERTGYVARPYCGKYMDQTEATGSRMYLDEHKGGKTNDQERTQRPARPADPKCEAAPDVALTE